MRAAAASQLLLLVTSVSPGYLGAQFTPVASGPERERISVRNGRCATTLVGALVSASSRHVWPLDASVAINTTRTSGSGIKLTPLDACAVYILGINVELRVSFARADKSAMLYCKHCTSLGSTLMLGDSTAVISPA